MNADKTDLLGAGSRHGYCFWVTDVASGEHLHSPSLVVPQHNLSMNRRREVAVAGPAAWNSLSHDFCDPVLSTDRFRRLLKTRLFSEY